ncbi:adenosylmethionine--8-amino-7-oxononanoate transaminase [Parafilimonas sp.]|uniref:adenosylmethionine--8-amino-7-oxononanoate transaminase n=1 Tax=Parafilimonas sp. TaxID=1969739 RepID=UPI0039E2D29F
MNLIERDRKYIWHPFTPQKNMSAPVAITKAKDSYLFDENGNAYIDAISSWWVNIHGHANEYIAQKMYEQALQLEHIIFAGFTHEPAVKLAERLLKILPGDFTKIFYSDDGSTSTEVAIKMAVQYWWNVRSTVNGQQSTAKNKLLAFKNSYHGDTFGAMSVSDRSVFTLAFHDILLDVIFIDTPDENNISSIKEEIAKHENSIAAFIYEPLVQGAGGIKMYDAALLDELLYFIQQKNIICIADEVMTGFGRTGKMFAGEYLQTKPDIICLSKGITGGVMALGVTACSEKIYHAYITDDARKTFFHGHSFTANPLACTAANASLDLFEKNNVLAQIENISAQNMAFAAQLKQLNGIKNVRTLGTILAFEMLQGDDIYLNNISQVITAKALEKGVYIRPLGNTVYIMPPYCITNEALEKVYAVLTEIL